jgi:uncharacterized Zn-binding protein involved in type VI secretion
MAQKQPRPKQVHRKGDANSYGGVIKQGDPSVLVNGRPVAVPNISVTPHPWCPISPIHCVAVTKGGSPTVFVNGKPMIRQGDEDLCGHPRAGGSPDVLTL